MTPDQVELARRAVTCKDWRWLPGMLAYYAPVGSLGVRWDLAEGRALRVRVLLVGAIEHPNLVRWVTADGKPLQNGRLMGESASEHLLPIFDDAPTLGGLLALVRGMWGDHAMAIANGFEEPHEVWSVHDGRLSYLNYGHEVSRGRTEAEVLVAALEKEPHNE